jgi:hypothetical protein
MNKHLVWAITTFSIILMICGAIIWINYNSWTIRFEMDDNTKEAIESMDFGEIVKEQNKQYIIDECGIFYNNGTIIDIDCQYMDASSVSEENGGKD